MSLASPGLVGSLPCTCVSSTGLLCSCRLCLIVIQVFKWKSKSFEVLGLCGQVQAMTQLDVTGSGTGLTNHMEVTKTYRKKAWGWGLLLRKSEQVWERALGQVGTSGKWPGSA